MWGKGDWGWTGEAVVTRTAGTGVRSIESLLSGLGPSSNLRLGDLQDLVVSAAVEVLTVVLSVVLVTEGLTDCRRCCSSLRTSARLVVC